MLPTTPNSLPTADSSRTTSAIHQLSKIGLKKLQLASTRLTLNHVLLKDAFGQLVNN
jgi:hypothetical protein